MSSVRGQRVSGTQLPPPAPMPHRKVSWLSLFFHAINERLERPLSMALWRLAFIPSSNGIPLPLAPRLPPLRPTCRRRGVWVQWVLPISLSLSPSLSRTLSAYLPFAPLLVFFAASSCLDCTFVSYCSLRHAQYAQQCSDRSMKTLIR